MPSTLSSVVTGPEARVCSILYLVRVMSFLIIVGFSEHTQSVLPIVRQMIICK